MIDSQWANNHGGNKKTIFAAAMETAFSEDAAKARELTPPTGFPPAMTLLLNDAGPASAETSGCHRHCH